MLSCQICGGAFSASKHLTVSCWLLRCCLHNPGSYQLQKSRVMPAGLRRLPQPLGPVDSAHILCGPLAAVEDRHRSSVVCRYLECLDKRRESTGLWKSLALTEKQG
nr:uncharacterized protein LOC129528023 [Gorilla gorilla gorilla]